MVHISTPFSVIAPIRYQYAKNAAQLRGYWLDAALGHSLDIMEYSFKIFSSVCRLLNNSLKITPLHDGVLLASRVLLFKFLPN